jgi:hypothetical protein
LKGILLTILLFWSYISIAESDGANITYQHIINSYENAEWAGACNVYLALLKFDKNNEASSKAIKQFFNSEAKKRDLPVPVLLDVCPEIIEKYKINIEIFKSKVAS